MAAAAREQGNDPLQAMNKFDLVKVERQILGTVPHGFVSEPLMVPQPWRKS
tara:strand:- start:666 stop:818 length:153 start_codon:yes stop_codon:yes gene_type:complete